MNSQEWTLKSHGIALKNAKQSGTMPQSCGIALKMPNSKELCLKSCGIAL